MTNFELCVPPPPKHLRLGGIDRIRIYPSNSWNWDGGRISDSRSFFNVVSSCNRWWKYVKWILGGVLGKMAWGINLPANERLKVEPHPTLVRPLYQYRYSRFGWVSVRLTGIGTMACGRRDGGCYWWSTRTWVNKRLHPVSHDIGVIIVMSRKFFVDLLVMAVRFVCRVISLMNHMILRFHLSDLNTVITMCARCWKTGRGRENGGTTSVYSWWYRVKKRLKENKTGAAKKPPTYLHIQIAGGTHRVGYTKWNVNTRMISMELKMAFALDLGCQPHPLAPNLLLSEEVRACIFHF